MRQKARARAMAKLTLDVEKIQIDDDLHLTIYNMISNDYLDRLKAEYEQVVIRLGRLENVIYMVNIEGLRIKSDIETLEQQRYIMGRYKEILEQRLKDEGIF